MLDDREQSVHQIAPGSDVCDVSGEKVGTVARVGSEVIEAQSGQFVLGKHLYVLPDAVDGVTDVGVILKHPKHEFHSVGLDSPPAQLNN